MIAPWKFKCDNLHIQFSAKFSPEKTLPCISEILQSLPIEARVSREMLLTISRMHSTCYSDNDFIPSYEAILKVMVDLHSVQYYFPIFALVDAPHSITRGAFLGYRKHIGQVEFGDMSSQFYWGGMNNCIEFKTLPSKLENLSLLPHLTYRNYRTPDFEAKGLSVIDIADYVASPILKCTSTRIDLPLLESFSIKPISQYKLGLVSDSFTVKGAKYV
ncbi:hypothetical protein [Pseudomonas sp. S1Bt23]|uniref:hypothetical protein n=1 Tax=Pseudomonas sp. S1Bt23 TaxID=3095074 RepID=UPI002A5A4945|nr:hypothetical protein [Pseudomonas sp. S1Bt23]WPO46647.1 hypothetical protein SHB59_25835 [Pseudomonas sp. S1Bt23]